VPDEVIKSCGPMIFALEESNVIKQISLADVLAELSKRILPMPDQVVAAMKYWIFYRTNNPIDPFQLTGFLKNLMISFPEREDGRQPSVMPLANINYFVNPKLISPPTLPVPHDVLPLAVSKNFSRSEMETCFGYALYTSHLVDQLLNYQLLIGSHLYHQTMSFLPRHLWQRKFLPVSVELGSPPCQAVIKLSLYLYYLRWLVFPLDPV
jgi:hypothetical protein